MPAAEQRRSLVLAAVCIVAWAAAAFAVRYVGQWIALGGAAVVLASACLVVDRRDRLRLLSWTHRLGVDLALGLGGGLVMTLATYALYGPVTRATPLFFRDVSHLYGAFSTIPDWIATLILVPIIVGEEIVWRGVVQTRLAARFSPIATAAIAVLIYTLAHAPTGSPILVLAALGCGVVWCTLRALTGGLVAPLIAHLVWDFSVLLVHPLAAPVVKL